MSKQGKDSPGHAPEAPQRRHFLVEFAAIVIGGLAGLVPAVAGAVFVLNPLFKKKSATAGADDGFRMVGSATGLTPQSAPMLFQVLGTKQDAWTTYPETPLGAVYVRMQDDGKLVAYNARCPHLGCTVNYRADKHDYICPCHDSSFGLNGERTNKIPPRNMDELEVELRHGTEVWVKFMNFRAGKAEKTPTA